MKSKHGGSRNPQESRFDLIPFEGLEAVGRVMAEGEERYGRLPDNPSLPNWTGLDLTTDQSPASHAVKHLYAYIAGDESEDNLAAAAANLLMLIWFRDNPSSRYYGLRYPEILGYREADEGVAPTQGSTAVNYVGSVLRSLGFPLPDDKECAPGT